MDLKTRVPKSEPIECTDIYIQWGGEGIYYHEHEVSMECEALKEVATSLSTQNNLPYNPVYKQLKILVLEIHTMIIHNTI